MWAVNRSCRSNTTPSSLIWSASGTSKPLNRMAGSPQGGRWWSIWSAWDFVGSNAILQVEPQWEMAPVACCRASLASGISVVAEIGSGWCHQRMCPVLCLAGERLGSLLRTVEIMLGRGCSLPTLVDASGCEFTTSRSNADHLALYFSAKCSLGITTSVSTTYRTRCSCLQRTLNLVVHISEFTQSGDVYHAWIPLNLQVQVESLHWYWRSVPQF